MLLLILLIVLIVLAFGGGFGYGGGAYRGPGIGLGGILLVILLILLLAVFETYKRWKARKSGEARAYYRVKPSHRAIVAAVYLTLIAVCVVGMDLTHLERSIPS